MKELLEDYKKKLEELANSASDNSSAKVTEDQVRAQLKKYIKNITDLFTKSAKDYQTTTSVKGSERLIEPQQAQRIYEAQLEELFNKIQAYLRSMHTQLFNSGRLFPIAVKLVQLETEMNTRNIISKALECERTSKQKLDASAAKIHSLEEEKKTNDNRLIALENDLRIKTEKEQKFKELAQRMAAVLPTNAKGQYTQELTRLTVEEGAQSTKGTAEVINITTHAKPVHKFSSNVIPVPNIMNTQDPYKNGMQCASYALSERRAAMVIELLRYYMKLTGWKINNKDSERKDEYAKEKAILDGAKVDIKEIITACIFYLFMEFQKGWEALATDVNSPAKKLGELARQYDLAILKEKLAKITPKSTSAIHSEKRQEVAVDLQFAKGKTRIDILTLSDDPYVGEGKTRSDFYSSGKYAKMFFITTTPLSTSRYHQYCGHYQVRTQHDENQLQALYQVSRQK